RCGRESENSVTTPCSRIQVKLLDSRCNSSSTGVGILYAITGQT
ncbi:hypothetical protein AVEN_160619-1, partial [Araneus ventricosus]